jgi:putative ABC transport system permease protein
MALDAVWTHKFRSALTILGIVIGITTVVTVSSLLTGLRKGIVDFFQEFGPDNIFLARLSGDPSGANARPKELKRRPMELWYADVIKKTSPSVEDVGYSLFPPPAPNGVVKVPGFETDRYFLAGQTANMFNIQPRELRAGRVFTPEEANRAAPVCVIGSILADALFPDGQGLNRIIQVNGTEYTVIGVFAAAKGGFFGENGLDTQVMLPERTLKLKYPTATNYFFTVKARPGLRQQAFDETENIMRRLRRVQKDQENDFALSTSDQIIQSLDRVTGMALVVSLALSGLGLLVGGIGVMNIMLVSVTERTREIGVRKALGARKSDIVLQFLLEAVSLTGLGGIVGVIVSILVTLGIAALVPILPSEVPTWAVLAGFLTSVAVGVFFGVWPATKAAQLDPVEALRYE